MVLAVRHRRFLVEFVAIKKQREGQSELLQTVKLPMMRFMSENDIGEIREELEAYKKRIRQSNPPSGRGVFLMHCRHDRNRRG